MLDNRLYDLQGEPWIKMQGAEEIISLTPLSHFCRLVQKARGKQLYIGWKTYKYPRIEGNNSLHILSNINSC